MTMFRFLAAAAAVGGIAAPLGAQTPYPYGYQPTYPQYPQQQAYPGYQQGYGQQGYGSQGAIGSIIDSLLGNRYNVSDRTAVSQCATAAMTQASAQYRGQGYGQGYGNGYNNAYGEGYGYNGAAAMRVTAITDVQRRSNGLRVSGLMSSGNGNRGQYGGQYGYANRGYAGGDLTFRCNVDYRGVVTNVRIRQSDAYRG